MTTPHERALNKAHELQFPPLIPGGTCINAYEDTRIEAICKSYLTALLSDPATVDKIAELQANGWEYGTHPRTKAEIVLQAIKEMV